MLMRGNQLAIYPHVELTVNAWNECEGRDVLAYPRQRVTRHPGGSERVSSILAVFDLYTQFVICHETAPRRWCYHIIGRIHPVGQQHLGDKFNCVA